MILTPIDETTAALVINALQTARTRCLSPVLALHQSGLLMTENNARLIRRDTLLNVAEFTRTTRIRSLHDAGLIAKEPTPATVVKAIAIRIEELAVLAEKGEFR